MTRHDDRDEAIVWRARLLAVCLALGAVAFRQKPGLVVADTKLDLTVNPWGFMGNALHLWDPQGAFGQLQNQAYGYLFPMGPFHALLHSAGVAPWVVQRLWWSLLLVVAFLGMWRLTTELAVGTRWLRLVGAVAFALCPRIASELTVTSVEVWPMAVAPWVLVPLVVRGDRTMRWRITRSALAFACCGGVNAVASGAALILPGLWFLTRRPNARLVAAAAQWLVAILVAMAWWLVPLVLLGGYSPPFLDWIEGANVTTSTASVFESLRGTTAWLGFLTSSTGPEWPGGWSYATEPMVIMGTMLLAGLGLWGLTLRTTPDRRWLALSSGVGLVLLGLGHVGGLSGPLAPHLQELLDGPLAALRNAHKFDVVLRIPLTIGLVAGLSELVGWLTRLGVRRAVSAVAVVSLLVVVTSPSLVSGLARSEAYQDIPRHWHEAASWLDAQPDAGSVLVLPAASFADFTWGSTKDDPLQPLMKRPFAVRDAVPLGSAGATRWLDGIERELGAGRGDQALARAMATAGIRFVVVRNDLRLDAQGDPLAAVHAGLEQSGLDRVATFGPLAGNPGESDADTVDYRTLLQRPSVEVFRVPGTSSAWVTPDASLAGAAAGPEDVVALTRDVDTPLALLGSDAGGGTRPSIATDGLRRREVNFGEPTNNASHVLTDGEATKQRRPVVDFINDPAAGQTTTTWTGVDGVAASSSASDANATLRLNAATRPGAALDGDPTTRWVSGRFGEAVGEWLQVNLRERREVASVRLSVSTDSPVAARPTAVVVSTAAGSRRVAVPDDGGQVFVGLPTGPTRWIRVTLADVGPGPQNGFAIRDLRIDGVTPHESLLLPEVSRADVVVLRRDDSTRPGCLRVQDLSYCAPPLVREPEGPSVLARTVRLGEGGSYGMRGHALPVPSTRTDALFDLGPRLKAVASSRLVAGPVDRPGAALDRDLGTGWVAGTNDFDPTFTLTIPSRREISGLQFLKDPSLAASGARAVTLTFSDGEVLRTEVDDEGYVRFAARSTRSVEITFGATRPLVNVDSASGQRTFVPVGFSELRVLGADDLRRPVPLDTPTGAACGFGPSLVVNGRAHATSVSGTLRDVAEGRPLVWSPCGSADVDLLGTSNDVVAAPSGEYTPQALTLTRTSEENADAVTPPRALRVDRASAASLVVVVPARTAASVVTVAQNFNAGWQATLDGRRLEAVRVNGWMQGWRVPAGSEARVVAHFEPDLPYRTALLAGAVALVLLGAFGLRRGRRPDRPLPEGRIAWSIGLLWTLAVALWLGGLAAGLVAVGVTVVAASVMRRRRGRAALQLGVVLVTLVAGAVVAWEPWPTGQGNVHSAAVQLLGVAAFCAVSALVWLDQRVPARVRG